MHQNELERIHDPHPLDYRYLEDFILEIEENKQIQVVTGNQEILPGIDVIHTPIHTDGGLSVLIETSQGKASITGFCTIMENFYPPKEIKAMEMEVIPPGTHVNAYESYDTMLEIKEMADILLPLHEPAFASIKEIPYSVKTYRNRGLQR